jgi:hypothetical protein
LQVTFYICDGFNSDLCASSSCPYFIYNSLTYSTSTFELQIKSVDGILLLSYANTEGSIITYFTAGVQNVGGDRLQNGMSGTK